MTAGKLDTAAMKRRAEAVLMTDAGAGGEIARDVLALVEALDLARGTLVLPEGTLTVSTHPDADWYEVLRDALDGVQLEAVHEGVLRWLADSVWAVWVAALFKSAQTAGETRASQGGFFLLSNNDDRGWWRPRSLGYTNSLAEAGRFSPEEIAEDRTKCAANVTAIPCDAALALASAPLMSKGKRKALLKLAVKLAPGGRS